MTQLSAHEGMGRWQQPTKGNQWACRELHSDAGHRCIQVGRELVYGPILH